MTDKDVVYKVTYRERVDGVWKHRSVACYLQPRLLKYPNIVALDYEIGKVTKPKIKGSAIFAFDSIAHAYGFIERSIGWRDPMIIFECEYAEAHKPLLAESMIDANNIFTYWKNVNRVKSDRWRGMYTNLFNWLDKVGKPTIISTIPAPTGTVMCKWVKPIKVAT